MAIHQESAAVAALQSAEYCRSLGASELINYADSAVTEHIRAACPDGVDIYIDTSGENNLARSVDLLATRGRIVVLAGMRTRPELPIEPLYLRDRSVLGFAISQATTIELAEAARALNQLLATGRLRPRHTETLPLSAAASAHRRVEAGGTSGTKLILRPDLDEELP